MSSHAAVKQKLENALDLFFVTILGKMLCRDHAGRNIKKACLCSMVEKWETLSSYSVGTCNLENTPYTKFNRIF